MAFKNACVFLAVCVAFLLDIGCNDLPTMPTPIPPLAPTETSPSPTPPPFVPEEYMVGAGDIGWCGFRGAEETGKLLDGIPGTVFTLGDNAYMNGTMDEFLRCYDPFWGRHKNRTRPAVGNHDYVQPGARGFFAYFGDRVLSPTGYYGYDMGKAWRVIVLNSATLDGAQLDWLRRELRQHADKNVLVQDHYPLVSSGPNGDNPQLRSFWALLQEFKADLFLAGHDHLYERFGRLNSSGQPDPSGIRQIIAGTGGARLYNFVTVKQGSEARGVEWGVLKIVLRADSYSWEFVPVFGGSFRDAGTDTVLR